MRNLSSLKEVKRRGISERAEFNKIYEECQKNGEEGYCSVQSRPLEPHTASQVREPRVDGTTLSPSYQRGLIMRRGRLYSRTRDTHVERVLWVQVSRDEYF